MAIASGFVLLENGRGGGRGMVTVALTLLFGTSTSGIYGFILPSSSAIVFATSSFSSCVESALDPLNIRGNTPFLHLGAGQAPVKGPRRFPASLEPLASLRLPLLHRAEWVMGACFCAQEAVEEMWRSEIVDFDAGRDAQIAGWCWGGNLGTIF